MTLVLGFLLPIVFFVATMPLKAAIRKKMLSVISSDSNTLSNKLYKKEDSSDSADKKDFKAKAVKMAANIAKKMTRMTLIALKMLLKFIRGVFIVIQFLIGFGLVGVVIVVVLMVAVMGACVLFMLSVTTDESTASVGTTISSADTTQTQTAKYKDIFWVGDSRTVGLGSSVLGFSVTNNSIINDSMCASVGQGLAWFTSDAITSKRNEIYALKGYNVIFNLGVNDYSGADQKYLDYYNNLPEDFIKNNNVCVMSVNPINATKCQANSYNVSIAGIEAFNEVIKNGLPDGITYIDTYSDMQGFIGNDGAGTVDGLHYTSEVYKQLYDDVLKKLGVSGDSEDSSDKDESSNDDSSLESSDS